DASDHLGAPIHQTELTVGYRVPGSILEFANRLLPEAAPGVRAPTSARTGGIPPRLLAVSVPRRSAAIAEEVEELTHTWNTLAVVAPPSLLEDTAGALESAGLDYVDGQRAAALGENLTLLVPANVKGLEFDAVLAIEPGRIVAEHEHGARLLYITLTRAVQQLNIVHA